jgi:tRNA(adenine34) deaminase
MDGDPKKADEPPLSTDERFMREALALAEEARAAGEVPIGAVLVRNEAILGRGFNRPISSGDPTAHAEITAIRDGAVRAGNYRLSGTTLYVTLEPCPMCAGALVHARVDRLVFGARDLRFGGVRSKFRIADSDVLNHQLQVTEGVLAADCLQLLRGFFESLRNEPKALD